MIFEQNTNYLWITWRS